MKPVNRFTKQCFFRIPGRIHQKVLLHFKWILNVVLEEDGKDQFG